MLKAESQRRAYWYACRRKPISVQHSAYSIQIYPGELQTRNEKLDTTSNLKLRTSNYYLSFDMKTKECPSCAMEVDINSKVCPICKYQFTRQSILTKMGCPALGASFFDLLDFLLAVIMQVAF